MKFADEFVESAGQVAGMLALMQNLAGKQIPLVFTTPYGKYVITATKMEDQPAPTAVPPVVADEKENDIPPEVD